MFTPTPGQVRYPLTPTGISESTSFTLTSGGRIARSALTGALTPFPLDNETQGAHVEFWGTGNDDTTYLANLWLIDTSRKYNPVSGQLEPASDCNIEYFGQVEATLSTYVGLGGGAMCGTSERAADTLTFTESASGTTPKGFNDLIQDAYASPAVQVYSPANNTPGRIIIPRFGWPCSLVIEFDRTGATGGFALIAPR